jgi:hypothetical protein
MSAALLFGSADSYAAPTAKEKAEAKVYVAEARVATKQKRHADAANALRKAVELDPNPQTKLDLARSLVELGKLVEASKSLNDVIAVSGAAPGAKKVVAASKKLLASIEPRVPWVKISVIGPPADQTTTTIDEEEVDASSEIPFDPGDHLVVAESSGYERKERRITLEEGEHELVKLKLTKKAAPVVAPVEPKSSGSVVPAAIAFGVGAAGLALGAVYGVFAFNETSNVEANCKDGRCPPDQAEALDIAKANGTVSTVGFVVGGVGVATGIVLLIVRSSGDDAAPKDEAPAKDDATEVSVRPWIGPGQIGLMGTF